MLLQLTGANMLSTFPANELASIKWVKIQSEEPASVAAVSQS